MLNFNCPVCGKHNSTTARNLLWLPYVCVCGEVLPIERIINKEVFAAVEQEIGRIARVVIQLTGKKNFYIAQGAKSAFIDSKLFAILGEMKIYDLILSRFERNETLQSGQSENPAPGGSQEPERRENVFRSLSWKRVFPTGKKDKTKKTLH